MRPGPNEEGRFDSAEHLLGDYLVRRSTGEALSFETFVAAHRELELELRELYSACGEVDDALQEGKQVHDTQIADIERMLASICTSPDSESRYAIEGEVGRGGMGAVLRVLDRKLGRPIAMKVILGQALGASTHGTPSIQPRQLARFLNEAKVTSRLEHPGIVPVHDIGVDDRGRAYFTMKLVGGRTLAEVFERQALGDPEWPKTRVLGLIQRVCEAVAYAHDNGVIHRDLKPANVMIGDFGEVYVMDWGLARSLTSLEADAGLALSGSATADVLLEQMSMTHEGIVLGTPAYMPPEQAGGQVEEMGPHSDVYSIGAMLYHLLANHPPYCSSSERLTGSSVIERIRSGPPAPIDRVSASPELVSICSRAMARERVARYPSVTELSGELRAFLDGRVVRAYETGPWAEARKWIRRNRALAATGLSAIAILIVGLITTVAQYVRAEDNLILARSNEVAASNAAKEAVTNAELAKAEAARANDAKQAEERQRRQVEERGRELEEVVAFQSAMLEQGAETMGLTLIVELDRALERELASRGTSIEEIDRARSALEDWLKQPTATTVSTNLLSSLVLEPAVRAAGDAFTDQPAVLASLFATIGVAYQNLGRADLALPLLQTAYDERSRLLGSEDPVTLVTLRSLGTATNEAGDHKGGIGLLQQAYEGLKRAQGEEDEEVLDTLAGLVPALMAGARLDDAEEVSRRCLEGYRSLFGESDQATLGALTSLAGVLAERGELNAAEDCYRRAIDGFESSPGQDPTVWVAALTSLTGVLRQQDRLAEAERCARKALELARARFGDEHPFTLTALHNKGIVDNSLQHYVEAEDSIRRALEGRRRILGADHSETLASLASFAACLGNQRRFVEAEPYYREALAHRRRLLTDDHQRTIISINNLCMALTSLGEYQEAEDLGREAVERSLRVMGRTHAYTPICVSNLVTVLMAESRWGEAEPFARLWVDLCNESMGSAEPRTLHAMHKQAEVLAHLERLDEAVAVLRSVVEGQTAMLGPEHVETLKSRIDLAVYLISLDLLDEAQSELEECEKALEPSSQEAEDLLEALWAAMELLYEEKDKREPDRGFDARAAEYRELLGPTDG